jgi:hypothetical protein
LDFSLVGCCEESLRTPEGHAEGTAISPPRLFLKVSQSGWPFLLRIHMKKTFELTHPKIQYARRVDAVKNEIRKYIKRERKKTLPEEVDFWDFDCRFGDIEADAKTVHLAEIDKCIDGAVAKRLTSFYVEILAKPGHRTKKPNPAAEAAAAAKLKAAVPEYKGFGKKNPDS